MIQTRIINPYILTPILATELHARDKYSVVSSDSLYKLDWIIMV